MKSFLIVLAVFAFAFWHYGAHFFLTILAISFLIFFHELGHFLAARICKVSVEVFSIGFGEKLFSKRFGKTLWCVSALPFGGYVKLKGQNDADPTQTSLDADSYNAVSPLGRIFILFAGPFFNLLLAFFIYFGVGFAGLQQFSTRVGEVLPNSAAHNVLQKDDILLAINGETLRSWSDISPTISATKGDLTLLVKRGEITFEAKVRPQIRESKNIFGEIEFKPMLGIVSSNQTQSVRYTGLDGVAFAFSQTKESSRFILQGLQRLLSGVVPLNDLGGIVAIADTTTKVSQSSLLAFFMLVALISVNLGVLNLLPLPVLDGGHIVFNLYELLTKKEVNEKIRVTLTYASMALLFGLMIFTIINDLTRLAS